ncbi:transposase [Plastorhodobacter daqingensis]|uniref:Transposase n=1 Tax=Plastorhodobacter daqingensis TaxID=1387281 RepID=A0ABW2ULR1_9RHOB
MRPPLGPTCSSTGGPSAGSELMIRMLLPGYCQGICSDRRLREEIGPNLAYRRSCRLGLGDAMPHSPFSRNRQGPFHACDLLRQVFEGVLAHRVTEVGGSSSGRF